MRVRAAAPVLPRYFSAVFLKRPLKVDLQGAVHPGSRPSPQAPTPQSMPCAVQANDLLNC